jgi:hypothetical protein
MITFLTVLFLLPLDVDDTHPRLIWKDAEVTALKQAADTDPVLQKCVNDVLDAAQKTLEKKPLEHRLKGPRLLSVSRECLKRIYLLGAAWRWTGEARYAACARENLLTVCAFADWNPSHFLDTAEMSHAVGIGYDWFFHVLKNEDRETIRKALIELGLKPGLEIYRKGSWWTRSAFNWNQVCNCGLIIGSLAIAETDPDYSKEIIAAARKSLPTALATYAPDGAWPEGPGYWGYATSYTVYGLAALTSALGTDYGLSDYEGLKVTGRFPVCTSGPKDLYLNFADAGERSRRHTLPILFYLARRYDSPELARVEHRMLEQNRASPFHLIWYLPPPEGDVPALPLDSHFRGLVEVAVFRSAWDDEDAIFAGVKAGYNQVNHGHLDLGNFELDAKGVRWARDLGSDDYNLPGYWDRKRNGKRWSYYRLNTFSHNVPVLDGQNQDPLGKAKILRFESTPARGFAVVDLTSAYKQATRVHRGLALLRDRKTVLLQDELDLKKPCEIAFGMTTDAEIALKPGGAVLARDGKELEVRIVSPRGAAFTVESAEQKPPDRANKGVHRLMCRLPDQQGSVRMAVLFGTGAVEVKPLADW